MNTKRTQRTRNIIVILVVAAFMGSMVACSCGGLGGGRSGGGGSRPATAPPSGGGIPPTPPRTPMPGLTAPAAPANLRVTSVTADYIRLAWDDNSDNEDGFQVFRQGHQGPAAQTDPNENQVQLDNLPCDQTYQFRVLAFNAAGNSDYSNVVEARTQPCGDSGAAGPDLVVEEVTGPPTAWTVNNPIPFQVAVRNNGNAWAQGAQWRWSINRTGEGPGQWNQGGRFDLAAGQSTTLQGSTPPQSTGNWTIFVEVRVDGEDNTENNRGTARVTVQ